MDKNADERIMVKLTASDQFVIFRTFTRNRKRSRDFYVSREELLSLRTRGFLITRDSSFAVFQTDEGNDALKIDFYWLRYSENDSFAGEVQSVTIPLFNTLTFAEQSALVNGPENWSVLSKAENNRPHLKFSSSQSLKAVVDNKLVRRKLSKFLRNHFNWPSATEVRFFGDFEPYSFFFREYRKDQAGICGGLILHGRENMDKAYYSVHT